MRFKSQRVLCSFRTTSNLWELWWGSCQQSQGYGASQSWEGRATWRLKGWSPAEQSWGPTTQSRMWDLCPSTVGEQDKKIKEDSYILRFPTCSGSVTPLFLPFGMGISVLCLSHHYTLEVQSLISQAHSWRGTASGWIHLDPYLILIFTWDQNLELMLEGVKTSEATECILHVRRIYIWGRLIGRDAMSWMFASPKFICWNPNLQGDGIRRWAQWLGHEGRALMNGPYKKTPDFRIKEENAEHEKIEWDQFLWWNWASYWS